MSTTSSIAPEPEGYRWNLRRLMDERGVPTPADLKRLLEERDVRLTYSQVWRLVNGPPERVNLRVLVALCDALACTPDDLVEPDPPPGPRAS